MCVLPLHFNWPFEIEPAILMTKILQIISESTKKPEMVMVAAPGIITVRPSPKKGEPPCPDYLWESRHGKHLPTISGNAL